MSNEIRFTDQELEELKDLQNQYQSVIYGLGQIQVEKRLLESREIELNSVYDSLGQKEKELLDSLNQKYGSGTINLENGTFTPNS
jgi:predicted nuclease with TOPRIM domain